MLTSIRSFNGFGRTLFVHLRREHELWTASDFCKKWCVTNSRYEKTSDTWDRHNLLMFWLGEDVLSVIPSRTEKLGNEMLGSLITGEAAWARHVSRDREMWRVVCSGVSDPFPNTGIIGMIYTILSIYHLPCCQYLMIFMERCPLFWYSNLYIIVQLVVASVECPSQTVDSIAPDQAANPQ